MNNVGFTQCHKQQPFGDGLTRTHLWILMVSQWGWFLGFTTLNGNDVGMDQNPGEASVNPSCFGVKKFGCQSFDPEPLRNALGMNYQFHGVSPTGTKKGDGCAATPWKKFGVNRQVLSRTMIPWMFFLSDGTAPFVCKKHSIGFIKPCLGMSGDCFHLNQSQATSISA